MSGFARVLVTGGAGFIGSNYVAEVCKAHPTWQVVVLDKLTYAGSLDNLEGVRDRITFVHGDIADEDDVERAMEGVDAVVNFAAESHVDRSLRAPLPFVHTNVRGVMVLLEAARRVGVKRFLHVSTDEVYGDLVGTEAHSKETDIFAPRSPYAATKAAAEHVALSYFTSFDVPVLITRGSNTYGPLQYPEKIIPFFIARALAGEPLPLYGDGSAVRDYMHVSDHARGIDAVLHHGEPGQAYNLGARLETPGTEVAERILAALGLPDDRITFVKDRPGHDYRYSVDPSKAEALGWSCQHGFAEGLADTVAWYVANQDWVQRRLASKDHAEHTAAWYAKREADEG